MSDALEMDAVAQLPENALFQYRVKMLGASKRQPEVP